MANSIELDDSLGAILDLDQIRKDFPSEDEIAKSIVLERPPTSSTLEKTQSLQVPGHGTHIHDSDSDLNIFSSSAVPNAEPRRNLRPRNASNAGASSSKAGQRCPRYGPYDRPPSHSPTTSEQRPAIFKCSYEGCEHETNREDNLKKHVKAVHLKVIKWICPICAKGITQRHNGPEHIARAHHIEHKCPVCFKWLDRKQMVQHFEDSPSTCIQAISDLCSRWPASQRHLFMMPEGN